MKRFYIDSAIVLTDEVGDITIDFGVNQSNYTELVTSVGMSDKFAKSLYELLGNKLKEKI